MFCQSKTCVQIWFLKLISFFHFSPSNSFCLWKTKLEKFFTRKEAQAYIQSNNKKFSTSNWQQKHTKKIKNQKRGLPDPSKCVRKHQKKFIHSEENHITKSKMIKNPDSNLFDPQVVINQENSTTVAMIFKVVVLD